MRREFCPNNTIIWDKFKRKRITSPNFLNINFPRGGVGEKKRTGPGRPAGGFVVFHLFRSKGFGIGLGLTDWLTGRAGGCIAD